MSSCPPLSAHAERGMGVRPPMTCTSDVIGSKAKDLFVDYAGDYSSSPAKQNDKVVSSSPDSPLSQYPEYNLLASDFGSLFFRIASAAPSIS